MKAVVKGIVSILLFSLALGAQAVLADDISSDKDQDSMSQEQGTMVEKAGSMAAGEDVIQPVEVMTKEQLKQKKADMKAEEKAERDRIKAEEKAEARTRPSEPDRDRGEGRARPDQG